MRLMALDWETFFDSKAKYSLKGATHTTESYIRDPKFKAHMLGYWLPASMAAPAECTGEMPLENASLRKAIETSACLGHHMHFDALILNHHYGLKPAFILDTLPMARLVLPKLKSHSLGALAQHFGLPEKNVPYNLFDGVRDLPPDIYRQVAEGCRHDVWLTYQIFLKLLPHVPKEELQVIDTTVRMYSEPVLELNRPRMEAFLKAEKMRKAKAMLEAGAAMGTRYQQMPGESNVDALRAYLYGVETELQSSAKFKIALEAIGYECPMKLSAKTGEMIPAIAKSDEEMKELLEHDDSRVQALAAARLGVKSTISESRAGRLLDSAQRGRLPVYLAYAAAKTLRFGGGDKSNWQNFPRGGEIRKSIVAPQGHKLVIGDLSQIEYRLLCWLTGQTDKLEALKAGRDLYSELAGEFYGYAVSKETPKERGLGKQITLSCGYGAGADSIKATAKNGTYGPPLQLTDTEALKARDLYRATHQRVVKFWDWCGKVALPALGHGHATSWGIIDTLRIADHKIWLPNDTAIDYTGLRWAHTHEIFPGQAPDGDGPAWWETSRKGHTRTWGSHVTADVTQALACVVIKSIMVRMAKRGWRPVLQCHDELVFCVLNDAIELCKEELLEEMTTPPAWCADIPLACEIISSQEYSK